MTTPGTVGPDAPAAVPAGLAVELNALNPIPEDERRGRPADLFWPWFGANVSVLGLGYGSYLLAFGVSFWQALIVGVLGIIASFLLCGFVSLAGRRGSAPTMVLSRASFGIDGNRLPALVSWVLTVGWETVLASLAVLATTTVFKELGWSHGDATQVVVLLVVVAVVIAAGVFGFGIVMRLQVVITWVTGVLTLVYFALVLDDIHWDTVSSLPGGGTPAVIGGFVFMMTGFGLGWVNAAADYSRYLPRVASGRGIVGWTTLGGAVAPVVLLVFGLLLAGSSTDLSDAIGADPIGALSTLLPTWFLVPFALVAVLGLIGGAALDIYSSGLALLSVGLPVPRYVAAAIDGVIMLLGAIYIVFGSGTFIFTFQGFLITLGVPIAAWCGVFLADVATRRRDYVQGDLYSAAGRYGSMRWVPVLALVLGTVVGWGLVTNTYAGWLDWQGYLLGPIGGRDGDWAFANLGVLVSLVIGFVGGLVTWLWLPPTEVEATEAA
ncbi:Purine-cytosine permease [Nocardioides terrae]|uniref:Purine-cytosine permease n=1 Tax=Nocardioides terrae TaxID=574651 RepID=A0A1I1J2E5_9ACTN|nr:cytosine permease [Nocardioides terrae]SFC42684.1 Purine-cytosine permease [Nocardioides terrae]